MKNFFALMRMFLTSLMEASLTDSCSQHSHQKAPERTGVPRCSAVPCARVARADVDHVLGGERGAGQRRLRPRQQEGLLHKAYPPRGGHAQDQGRTQCENSNLLSLEISLQ